MSYASAGHIRVAENDACENDLSNSSAVSDHEDESQKQVLSPGLGNCDNIHILYGGESESLVGKHGLDASQDEEDKEDDEDDEDDENWGSGAMSRLSDEDCLGRIKA